MAEPAAPGVRVKIPDEILRGSYANQMVVTHTREEFVMDWASLLPPEGIVVARVIVSPGHMKRVLRALTDNLRQYEERHGAIPDSPEPEPGAPPAIVN